MKKIESKKEILARRKEIERELKEMLKKTDEELVGDAGRIVIGTPSGLGAQHAQAELTRRLIRSIDNLNTNTSYYSKILIGLTVAIGVLTLFQIISFFIKQ